MKTTVVYSSRYGNTAKVAQAIATSLEAAGPVRLVEATDATAFDVAGVDLLVVGGPTEGHGMSQAMRERLKELSPRALGDVSAATFDTRINWPAILAGSAAHGIAHTIKRNGARLVVPPESFLVTGKDKNVHLVEGELERARAWAGQIRDEIAVASAVST